MLLMFVRTFTLSSQALYEKMTLCTSASTNFDHVLSNHLFHIKRRANVCRKNMVLGV